VLGITWREAAMYVNWLNNDKATDLWAIMDGAYDVSTFGFEQGIGYTDQAAHHPDARYWIPTLDEWLKAVYYDPDKEGLGDGGWWMYPDGSNTPLTVGPPGVGETNGGPFDGANNIPLGAYGVTTPWGLLDASGGAAEWTEELATGTGGIIGREYLPSYIDLPNSALPIADSVWAIAGPFTTELRCGYHQFPDRIFHTCAGGVVCVRPAAADDKSQTSYCVT
jgi:sulfatase modifying factor 1